jgi:cyclopropane-fatty-acyl-phospholipid synthase
MSDPPVRGASVEAIEAHYDLGNDFFELWLDESMTYTCALWDAANPQDTLAGAQARKRNYLIGEALAAHTPRVLDVGCGWGGLLRHLVAEHGVTQATGLTLSRAQADFIEAQSSAGVEVLVESWADHVPQAPYDAILSVEAFEAFARLGQSSLEKTALYREFFECCHAWLVPGGRLALQTIAYGNAGPEDFDEFIASEVFPESDLPRLAEIASSIERLFEVVTVRNRRADYVLTLRAWLVRLKAQRARAVALVGEAVVVRFERYLRLSIYMFDVGTCDLLQFTLRRIDHPRPSRPGATP